MLIIDENEIFRTQLCDVMKMLSRNTSQTLEEGKSYTSWTFIAILSVCSEIANLSRQKVRYINWASYFHVMDINAYLGDIR